MDLNDILAYITAVLIILSATAYILIKHKYLYWQRCGIEYLKPKFPFGNLGRSFMQKVAIAQDYEDLYKQTSEPYIGIYGVFRPILLVRDPKLIRDVLVKDFQYFINRGVHYDEKDPLSINLFAIDGEQWKNLRAKLSPAFSSGKLKAMFSTLIDCSVPLSNVLDRTSKSKDQTIEIRDLLARYTMNVIASIGFGIEINCIDNADAPFRKFGQKFFEPSLINGIRFFAQMVSPNLLKLLRLRLIDQGIEDFMISTVKQNLHLRETDNVVRKDFFQLLVQLRNSGNISTNDDQWETQSTGNDNKKLSINQMTAHAFVFFIAGYETSSTTTSFLLYEVSKNREIQQNIQSEIDSVLANYNGNITYEAVNEMKYLDACIDGEV